MQNTFAPTRIDSAEMTRLIEENLSAKSMDFSRLPGGIAQTGNPTWFTSGLKRAGYNGITWARFDPHEVDQQIESCLEPFRQDSIPPTWWVGPLSEPGSLGQALQAHSFHHNRDMIGMAAHLDSLAEIAASDLNYRFEPVLDRVGLEAWLPLFMETFGMQTDDKDFVLDTFSQLSFPPGSEWRHYLLRVDGKVAATSSLHLGAEVAGLYNIATRHIYRQHGLGTAITLLTLEEARHMGLSVGTLQTTYPNALRLYHRMGFEVYCKIGVYQKSW